MKRRRGDDRDSPGCEFCGQDRPGETYTYYAGKHLDTKKRRAFLSSTTHVTSTYQGIHKYFVFVCDACTTKMRRKRYLPAAIGYSVAFLACAGAAAYVYLTKFAGDQMGAVLSILALFGGLAGLLGGLELFQAFVPSSGGIEDVILNRLKLDPRRVKDQGDSFFTEAEFRAMFKDADVEEGMSAEDLIRMDAGRSDRPRRKKADRDEATKECPHCGGVIPEYAEACKHCKKILA